MKRDLLLLFAGVLAAIWLLFWRSATPNADPDTIDHADRDYTPQDLQRLRAAGLI